MADGPSEVALFPLNLVLFPGMALPLNVFEPRYVAMVAQCLETGKPFGVMLARPESLFGLEVPYPVGTLARIVDHQRLPDGRYILLTHGTQRVRVLRESRDQSCLRGLVTPLCDEDESPDMLVALAREARDAFVAYLGVVLTLVGSEERTIAVPQDPTDLSYTIGMCLTCEDAEKQKLLEMTYASERLQAEIALLRAETQELTEQTDHQVPPRLDSNRAMLN
ncbi:MAG TPA: LON peptidase substrate-binding domain-containing protein [Ktedonobacterales bacterium]|nr:LON peptidase substrate-binding domain-containing protein [Ktedonobacterales bacterium]